MSLDAIVFRGLNSLKGMVNPDEIQIYDPETGQYAYKDISRPSPWANFVACQCHLTNIAGAAELRQFFAPLMSSNSVLLSRVIRDGSHSGDQLALDEVARLSDEIERLEMPTDSFILDFIHNLQELIVASRTEGNPIVFV